jgi:hypothetical protein
MKPISGKRVMQLFGSTRQQKPIGSSFGGPPLAYTRSSPRAYRSAWASGI